LRIEVKRRRKTKDGKKKVRSWEGEMIPDEEQKAEELKWEAQSRAQSAWRLAY